MSPCIEWIYIYVNESQLRKRLLVFPDVVHCGITEEWETTKAEPMDAGCEFLMRLK